MTLLYIYNLLWYSKSNFIEVTENVVESQGIELCQLFLYWHIFSNLPCSHCNSTWKAKKKKKYVLKKLTTKTVVNLELSRFKDMITCVWHEWEGHILMNLGELKD